MTITITKNDAGSYDILAGETKVGWAKKTPGRRYEVTLENGTTQTVVSQKEARLFVEAELDGIMVARDAAKAAIREQVAEADAVKPIAPRTGLVESVLAEIDGAGDEPDVDEGDAESGPPRAPIVESGPARSFDDMLANPPKPPAKAKRRRGPTILDTTLELAATTGVDFHDLAAERGTSVGGQYNPMHYAVKAGRIPHGIELLKVRGLEGHGRRFVAFTREAWDRYVAEHSPEGAKVELWHRATEPTPEAEADAA